MLDIQIIKPQAIAFGRYINLLRVLNVETFACLHQVNKRKLQPLAGMNGHHPHKILVLAQ